MEPHRVIASSVRPLNGHRWVTVPLLLVLLVTRAATVQAQFEYTIQNGGIVITRYNCAEGAVVIPSSIDGRVVTTLGEQAFSGCPGLTSVTIPNSITAIEDGAFHGCAGLTSVTIPNSVTRLGIQVFADCTLLNRVTIPNSITNSAPYWFEGCTALTRVTVENGVTSIPPGAFLRCSGLARIDLPDSVINIGGAAFSGCSSLKGIEVEALNPVYSSVDGVLFNKGRTTLVQFPGGKDGNYTVPNSVTTLGQYAFSDCTGLSGIQFPEGLVSIGLNAFSGCTGLTGVILPNSVTSIEYGAFSGCTSLVSVTIENGVARIPAGAFTGCHELTTVTIPNSVTAIGYRAFQNCVNLSGVYFQGNAPASDEYEAFEDSDGVTVYYLPGTTGWETTYNGRPTAPWLQPLILSNHPGFGANADGFTLTMSWAPNASVVVEASLDLDYPVWTPISTNLLTGGSSQFTDSQWTHHATRLYRLRTP